MMDITQSIHDYMRKMLSHPSKKDGRIWIMVSLLSYFGFLFVANFFVPYHQVWRKLGVSALPSFIDLRAVLAGFECTRLGYDVLLDNPCTGSIIYPRLWWKLTGLGLNQSHTVMLGIILALGFYLVTFAIIGRLNCYESIIYSLILCSPAVMLLIERGNVDIIIYGMLFLTLIMAQSQQISVRILGYIWLLIPTFLKILSFFCLTIILKEKRKTFVVWFISLFTISAIYIYSIKDELAVSKAYFIIKTSNSFGYKILLYKWPSIFLPSHLSARKIHLPLTALFIVGLIGLAFFLFKQMITFLKEIKQNFLRKDNFLPKDISVNTKLLDAFRIGSSFYLGTFVVTISFDYKLTFLIFAIPQMISWIKQDHPKLAISSSFALLGIVLTVYLSSFFSASLVDELINWFLWFYFLYGFLLTLPNWIKLAIHRLIPKKMFA